MKGIDKIKLYNNARSAAQQALISVIAVAVALAVGMLIIALINIDPFLAMKKNLFIGALATRIPSPKRWSK
jgi:uncharacterized membrane protein